MSLTQKIYNFIRQNHLIPPDSTLLIAVSGGVDSLVLLHILRELRPRLRRNLHVATLDHQLRRQAGADDAAFVVRLCHDWNIPVTSGAVDVRALAAQQNLGIEAAARQARYAFLAQTARQINTHTIAVAHHADDQAETILMHLIRGSGLQGLSGMRDQLPLPGHPDLILLRPLLTTSRQEIEAYSQQNHLQPRTDATNQDTTYLRNRLRLEILPALREINPAVHLTLLHMADNAATDFHYINQQLNDVITASVTTEPAGVISIDRAVFQQLHPALQRHFMLWAAQTLDNDALDYPHILQALEIGQNGQQGAVSLLPGGLQLRVAYDKLLIEPQAASALSQYAGPLLPTNFETYLQIPGNYPITGTQWSIGLDFAASAQNTQQLAVTPDSKISLRTRQQGDIFAPSGLAGKTQKLNKWLINHKIPRELRDFIPILDINGTIAAFYVNETWIVSHHYAVVNDQQYRLHVFFTKSHN